MEPYIQPNSRLTLRLLCGLIALLSFGYLVEICIMGAPDPQKHSDRIFRYDSSTPGPFWTQFVIFALIGSTAAYCSIAWKKSLPHFVAIEERDRKYQAALGRDTARRIQRGREAYVIFSCVIMGALLGLLAIGLIRG